MIRILYVEDDPVNALVMRKFLEKNFDFQHVDEGESALHFLTQNTVDLILMDINLGRGKKDGVETLQQIRTLPAFAQTPVIAITAYAMPEDKSRFLSLGFTAYVPKPVERTEIINLIDQLVSQK